MNDSKKERINFLEGLDVWHTRPFEDLPSIMMADGPHGLRKQNTSTDNLGLHGSTLATAFPTASLMACSFDRNLMYLMAQAIAKEAQSQNVHIVLGPGINIKRSPLCGRNFEYFSEDPYLTGELAASYVRGMQDLKTGTSVKHFCCNNQEKNRFFIDSIVDDRALNEIYLKAFKRVLSENPATLMTSYNKINGFYGTENPLIESVVRKQWGYQGVTVSDWGAVHQKISSIKAGNDLEMPTSHGYHAQQVLNALDSDDTLEQAVNQSVARIKKLVKTYKDIKPIAVDYEAHHELSKNLASASMVLLKNENILPLNPSKSTLVVGGFYEKIRIQGGGSSHVNPYFLDQMNTVHKTYSQHIIFSKGYDLNPDFKDEIAYRDAIELAKKTDQVIFLLGLTEADESEGFDREHLNVPRIQTKLLRAISEVNQNVVVVCLGGSVMNLSWIDQVKGCLLAYLGGQASASAIYDILYGIKNPSGRLAETFIDHEKDCNVRLTNDNHSTHYEESIFVGYRFYETFHQNVRFPFGYGLSYTTFSYDQFQVVLKSKELRLSVEIVNSGQVDGSEVIQIYVSNPKSTVFKPIRELKAFDKIHLQKGSKKTVEISIDLNDLKIFDTYEKKWVLESGTYEISVAKNAHDMILTQAIDIKGQTLDHERTSYHRSVYDVSDFKKIYQKELPPKHMIKKRPYHLSSTLEDIRRTWIGKVIVYQMVKSALKQASHIDEPWMVQAFKKTIMETPIRTLALFSAGKFSLVQAEGLIDVINLKWIKGIKKLKKIKL